MSGRPTEGKASIFPTIWGARQKGTSRAGEIRGAQCPRKREAAGRLKMDGESRGGESEVVADPFGG